MIKKTASNQFRFLLLLTEFDGNPNDKALAAAFMQPLIYPNVFECLADGLDIKGLNRLNLVAIINWTGLKNSLMSAAGRTNKNNPTTLAFHRAKPAFVRALRGVVGAELPRRPGQTFDPNRQKKTGGTHDRDGTTVVGFGTEAKLVQPGVWQGGNDQPRASGVKSALDQNKFDVEMHNQRQLQQAINNVLYDPALFPEDQQELLDSICWLDPRTASLEEMNNYLTEKNLPQIATKEEFDAGFMVAHGRPSVHGTNILVTSAAWFHDRQDPYPCQYAPAKLPNYSGVPQAKRHHGDNFPFSTCFGALAIKRISDKTGGAWPSNLEPANMLVHRHGTGLFLPYLETENLMHWTRGSTKYYNFAPMTKRVSPALTVLLVPKEVDGVLKLELQPMMGSGEEREPGVPAVFGGLNNEVTIVRRGIR